VHIIPRPVPDEAALHPDGLPDGMARAESRSGKLQPGETVLIHAAGGGLVSGNPAGRKMARRYWHGPVGPEAGLRGALGQSPAQPPEHQHRRVARKLTGDAGWTWCSIMWGRLWRLLCCTPPRGRLVTAARQLGAGHTRARALHLRGLQILGSDAYCTGSLSGSCRLLARRLPHHHRFGIPPLKRSGAAADGDGELAGKILLRP